MRDPFAALLAADAAAVLSDVGSVAVAAGAGSSVRRTRGVFEAVTDDVGAAEGARVQATRYRLEIPAGALGTLKRNVAVTVRDGPLAGTYYVHASGGEGGDGLTDVVLLGARAA